MEVGLRVVRDPDWHCGEEDGGEGHAGTVAEATEDEGGGRKMVVVQWDCGRRCKYDCVERDLRVLDSAPTGLVHPHVTCTWCDECPIIGMVWKCSRCFDYHLCTPCYMADKHSLDHEFDRSQTRDLKKRVRVPARFTSVKLPVIGIFKGAKVVRGYDWGWSNQDGGCGNIGHVTKIEGWNDETYRSVANVLWTGDFRSNVYRRAHRGKVDLKYHSPSSGGYYYPQHLPKLGCMDPVGLEVTAGDFVMVQLNPDDFKLYQDGHGGWTDQMAEFIGRVGKAVSFSEKGTVIVQYTDKIFILNEAAITKVDIPYIQSGDVVRIIDDMLQVHELQAGHGEWNDDMALALGQIGRVIKVLENSDVRVAVVNGQRWTLNPECMIPLPASLHDVLNEEFFETEAVSTSRQEMAQAMVGANVPGVVHAIVAAGNSAMLKQYLIENPQEVHSMDDGKSVLHVAIAEYHMQSFKTILQFNPDVDTLDESGRTPLHICSYVNNSEAAKLLLDNGANVNATDPNNVTAIIVASALGHLEVLKTLVNHPLANLDKQDNEGETALHRAVFKHHCACVRMLLQHGANPSLSNFDLQLPLHSCVGYGFLAGVEEMLRHRPEYINLKKDDGYTPLHVAVANNHSDLATYLSCHLSCDVDSHTKDRLTPLHIACHEGHVKIVERLVGYGANLNLTSHDGSTPLHLVLGKTNMTPPSRDTPTIKKIQDEVESKHGRLVVSSNVIVGLFLVANGADLYVKNLHGMSPMSLQPADSATLLKSYVRRDGSFHGSLQRTPAQTFTDPPRPVKVQASERLPSAADPDALTPSDYQRSQSNPPVHKITTDFNRNMMIEEGRSLDSAIIREKIKVNNKNEANNQDEPLEAERVSIKKKEIQDCFICEGVVATKLIPCGHTILCTSCARRAKKCPKQDCRNPVKTWNNICVLCMCDNPISTFEACDHTYCSGCKEALQCCVVDMCS